MDEIKDIEINGKVYNKDKIMKFDVQEIKDKNVYDDFRNANTTHIYFELDELPGKTIILAQNHKLDKGGIFWDGSYLLSRYFFTLEPVAKDFKPEKPLRILELGGATSLPSICAAFAGHKVISTDLENIL